MQGVHQLLCRLPPAGHGDILHECAYIYIDICIHACLAIHDVVSDDDKVGDDGGDDNNGHSGDFADNIGNTIDDRQGRQCRRW